MYTKVRTSKQVRNRYAVSFLLQDETQTLNDKMIDKIMSKLVKNLEDKLNAKLR